MADIQVAAQSSVGVATPGSGNALVFVDSIAKILTVKDDTGVYKARSQNAAITSQGAGFASDTYVTNSNILIPSWGLQAKTTIRWQISASKTAASTATPIYTVRIGSAGSAADTSRLALTGPAQTAVADIATLNILLTVRSVGSGTSAVIQGTAWWDHRGTAASSTIGVGFANDGTGHVEGTSAGFDSSALVGGTNYIGLSINGGTSAAWTLTQVVGEANW